MDRLLPRVEFVRTEMYNELFPAIGDDTGRCMGVMTVIGPSLLVTAVHRPFGGAVFTAE